MNWHPIQGFPKYSVNTLGQVRHNRTERVISPQINQFGVPYVGLMREEGHFNRSLALLVARTFIPQGQEYFDTPINMDWDRFNCAVHNLMWRPRWFAIRYHQQAKVPYENPIMVPVRLIDDDEVYYNSVAASKRYGLLERDVVMSILNRTYAWPTYQQFEMVPEAITY